MKFTFVVFFFSACLLSPCGAAAQTVGAFMIEDFSQTVAAGKATTYADLLRTIFPDFAGKNRKINDSVKMRLILPLDDEAETFNVGNVYLENCQGVWLTNGGRRHLALLVSVRDAMIMRSGVKFSFILAAFGGDDLKLLDAVNVNLSAYRRVIGFWDESPLLPILTGEDALWLIGAASDSRGNLKRDFRLVTLQNNRFAVVLDELPTVGDSSGWFSDAQAKRATRFEAKQRLQIVFPKSNPAFYRPFALEIHENLRTFDVEYRPNPIVIDPQDAPPDYDKRSRYEATWDANTRRYKIRLAEESVVISPLTAESGKFAEEVFSGALEVGRTYAASVRREKGVW